MKSKIIKILLVVFNVIYIAIGWIIYIVYDMSTPHDQKFDLEENSRKILLLLLAVYIIGEIFILKKFYKKVFDSNLKHFMIYMVFDLIVCTAPYLVALIEMLRNLIRYGF